MSEPQEGASRTKRAITAGLSTVGAAAGLAGLAYAGRDIAAARSAGKLIPLRTKALLPLEAVGLGGEVASTKILGSDARKKKQQAAPVAALTSKGLVMPNLGLDPRNGHGRRLVDEAVSKDRRYDPEADRQRRTGTYAGILGGSGIAAATQTGIKAPGNQGALRRVTQLEGEGKDAKRVTTGLHFVSRRARNRALGFGGAAAGLGAASLATYAHGISQRNQPWS